MDATERARIHRIDGDRIESVEDTLVVERRIVLRADDRVLVDTACSPGETRAWALGFLLSEGWIRSPTDVRSIDRRGDEIVVSRSTSAPDAPEPPRRIDAPLTASPDRILSLAAAARERASLFEQTGGTHAVAIARGGEILAFSEDISRTCALEKALGIALDRGIPWHEAVAFLSSRVPSRMIAKLARCGVPIVAAVSAPTRDAVRLAEAFDICLCGFVRGDRLNVYSHGWRLGL